MKVRMILTLKKAGNSPQLFSKVIQCDYHLPRVGDNLTLGPFSELCVQVICVIFNIHQEKKLDEGICIHLDGTKLENKQDAIRHCLVGDGWKEFK